MAIFLSHVEIKYDAGVDEYTASISYCEPAPGIVIGTSIEATGETLSEALRNLSEQIELTGMREDVLA